MTCVTPQPLPREFAFQKGRLAGGAGAVPPRDHLVLSPRQHAIGGLMRAGREVPRHRHPAPVGGDGTGLPSGRAGRAVRAHDGLELQLSHHPHHLPGRRCSRRECHASQRDRLHTPVPTDAGQRAAHRDSGAARSGGHVWATVGPPCLPAEAAATIEAIVRAVHHDDGVRIRILVAALATSQTPRFSSTCGSSFASDRSDGQALRTHPAGSRLLDCTSQLADARARETLYSVGTNIYSRGQRVQWTPQGEFFRTAHDGDIHRTRSAAACYCRSRLQFWYPKTSSAPVGLHHIRALHISGLFPAGHHRGDTVSVWCGCRCTAPREI